MKTIIISLLIVVILVIVGVVMWKASHKMPVYTPGMTTIPMITTPPPTPLWILSTTVPFLENEDELAAYNKMMALANDLLNGKVVSRKFYFMNDNGVFKPIVDNPMLVPTKWMIDPLSGVLTTQGDNGLLAVTYNGDIVPYVGSDASKYTTYDFVSFALTNINYGSYEQPESVKASQYKGQ